MLQVPESRVSPLRGVKLWRVYRLILPSRKLPRRWALPPRPITLMEFSSRFEGFLACPVDLNTRNHKLKM